MTLVKRNPNHMFPSIFDEFFRPDWMGGMDATGSQVPAVNILEKQSGFSLELLAPGLKKEQFNIEVDKNLLTISSETQHQSEHTEADGKYSRREFSFNAFRRSFTLPETVDNERITAAYEDGILKLEIPKKEEALPKPKRLIEIA